jgi:hypothetical protein
MHLLPQVVQEKESRITADGEAMRGIEARIQDKDTAYRTALTDIQQLKEDLKESQRELTKYMNRVQQLDGAVHSKNDIMRKQVRHPLLLYRPAAVPALCPPVLIVRLWFDWTGGESAGLDSAGARAGAVPAARAAHHAHVAAAGQRPEREAG